MKSPGKLAATTIALFAIITAQAAGGAIHGHKPLPGKTVEINFKNKRVSSATTMVNDGDTLRLCNRDDFFHKPFSISKPNNFSMTIKPGECQTITARNPTDQPMRLAIFDDIHAYEKLVLTVLRAGADATEEANPSKGSSDDSDVIWSKAVGRWRNESGSLVFELVDLNKADREDHPDEPIKVEGYVRKVPATWPDKVHVGDCMFISNKVDGDTIFGRWISAPEKEDCPELPIDWSSCSLKIDSAGDTLTLKSESKQYWHPKCEWSDKVKPETKTYYRVK